MWVLSGGFAGPPASAAGPRPPPHLSAATHPAGLLALVPSAASGLHWFVHSLATPMRFKLQLEGAQPGQQGKEGSTVARGTGLAHFEKNWGLGFPQRWHWAQAIDASAAAAAPSASGGNETRRPAASAAAFVLAGGQPPTPLLPAGLLSWLPDVWICGVRAPGFRSAGCPCLLARCSRFAVRR